MKILGIDPGSRYTGYGIIEKNGSSLKYVTSGRINATSGDTFADRLGIIFAGLEDLLSEHDCDAAAVETIFAAKNVMSTIKLGHARGVSLLALTTHSLSIAEYAPATIKQVVAGNGAAKKADVQFMVTKILGIEGKLSEDASDALAIAICHCHHKQVDDRLVSSIS